MMTIRSGHYDDIFEIEALLIKARDEIDLKDNPHQETPYIYHDLIHQAEAGLLIVAEDGGYVCGVMALATSHWPWNRKQGQHLINNHFYVDPEYRRGGTARKLLEAAKVVARERGMPLRIDLMGAGSRELKDRFCEMSGLRYLGGIFLYEGEA